MTTRGQSIAWAFAALVLAAFTIYSSRSMTHGFVAYYAASRLLVAGELGPRAYDDRWFGAYVQDVTQSSVREIFTPNPPTMSLMAIPIVWLDARTARMAWLALSLVAFLSAVWALLQWSARNGRHVTVPVILLVLLAPPVFTNLRIGQGYLLVFALFGAAVILLGRGRNGAGGALLGALLALKTSGVALAVLLAARRRWRALAVAAIVAILLALAITPFIDPAMWTVYPDHVRAYVNRPASSVTAYQTTLSLFRRLCVADPVWNPSPAASCSSIAFVIPALLTGGATLLTAIAAMRSRRPEPWLAAAAALSILTLPAVAEPHFVLLGIPLLLIKLRPLELALVATLLIIPLEITAERFTAGWSVLLAYPRLYAAWLLWAASVRATASRLTVTTCGHSYLAAFAVRVSVVPPSSKRTSQTSPVELPRIKYKYFPSGLTRALPIVSPGIALPVVRHPLAGRE